MESAIAHHSEEYLSIAEAIREGYTRRADELISSVERLECLKEDIIDECNLITRLIGAAQVCPLKYLSRRVKGH